LARDPIRPNSAWKALGVIGPSRSVIKTCEDTPCSRNGDGTADLLLRNDQTGGLQVYNIKDDKIVGTAFLGVIGTDWMYAGVGPIADDSSQNLLLRNTSGDLESYTIENNAIVDAQMAGHTDPAQTMVVGLVQAMSSNLGENGSAGSMTVAQQPEQQQTMLSQPYA
jgi:hypothetical protein